MKSDLVVYASLCEIIFLHRLIQKPFPLNTSNSYTKLIYLISQHLFQAPCKDSILCKSQVQKSTFHCINYRPRAKVSYHFLKTYLDSQLSFWSWRSRSLSSPLVIPSSLLLSSSSSSKTCSTEKCSERRCLLADAIISDNLTNQRGALLGRCVRRIEVYLLRFSGRLGNFIPSLSRKFRGNRSKRKILRVFLLFRLMSWKFAGVDRKEINYKESKYIWLRM